MIWKYLTWVLPGILLLVLVMGIHAMAFQGGFATITPNQNTEVVSTLTASYTFSSAIGPTSSNPLYVYLPGNMYLGTYSDGFYYGALNITVTLYNPGSTSGTATVYVSCPSPLGSASTSVTVGATSSATATITLAPNLQGQVITSGMIACQVYTSLTTNNVTAISVQVPIGVSQYGVDYYAGAYHPAFTESFNAPYFVFSGTTYEPTLSIYALGYSSSGALTVGSQLYLVQTGVGQADDDAFSLPTPTSAGQLYNLEFIYVSLPYYSANTGYYYGMAPYTHNSVGLLGANGERIEYVTYYGFQSGANWYPIYMFSGNLSLVFNTNANYLLAYVTNASGSVNVRSVTVLQGETGNVITAPAIEFNLNGNQRFYAMALVIDSSVFYNPLPVPLLFMFQVNIVPISQEFLSYVINETALPLPSGVSVTGSVSGVAPFTARFNITTPLGTLTQVIYGYINELYSPDAGLYGSSLYSAVQNNNSIVMGDTPGSNANYLFIVGYTVPTIYQTAVKNVIAPSGPMAPLAQTPPGYAVLTSTSSVTPGPTWTGPFIITNPIEPVFNITGTLSGAIINVTLGLGSGYASVGNEAWYVLYVQQIGYLNYFNGLTDGWLAVSAGPVSWSVVGRHVAVINIGGVLPASGNGYLGVSGVFFAYPLGNLTTPAYEVFPNGTVAQVGNTTIPIYTVTRFINESAVYVVNDTTMTLFISMTETPQVVAVYNGQYVGYVTVSAVGASPSVSTRPTVITSQSGPVFMGFGVATPTPTTLYTYSGLSVVVAYDVYKPVTTFAVTYQSTNGPVTLDYPYPSGADDPLIEFMLPYQPQTVVAVSSVSVSPSVVNATAGSTVSIKVTINLTQAVPSSTTYQGIIMLNGTQVAMFTITVPAGSSSASTTVSFTAPTTPGRYVGTVSVGGASASFTLNVTMPTTPVVAWVALLLAIIALVIGYIAYTRRRSGGGGGRWIDI